ncbi:hypothetical protein M446_0306 [Methylobacterium sp. 4-46]|nr:hypothetical protein M446_0306 [Methylobacterium sp. 4-46]
MSVIAASPASGGPGAAEDGDRAARGAVRPHLPDPAAIPPPRPLSAVGSVPSSRFCAIPTAPRSFWRASDAGCPNGRRYNMARARVSRAAHQRNATRIPLRRDAFVLAFDEAVRCRRAQPARSRRGTRLHRDRILL